MAEIEMKDMAAGPPSSEKEVIERVDKKISDITRLSTLLDGFLELPCCCCKCKIGIDAIVGFFFPALGDIITFFVGISIVIKSICLGLNCGNLLRMLLNLFIDWLLGTVPIIGDILDIFWRANMMNKELLKQYLIKKEMGQAGCCC